MLTIKVDMGSWYFMEETPFVQTFDKYGYNPYVSYKSLRQEFFREIKTGEVSVINSAGVVIDKIDLRKASDTGTHLCTNNVETKTYVPTPPPPNEESGKI